MWVFIAFGSSFFYGAANVLDNFLTNRLFKSIWTLVFWGLCIDILFLPVIWYFAPPALPPVNMLPFIILTGFLEIAYLFPYYKALQKDDTSVVSSLFSLGRIFIPAFAFLIVGEVLKPEQYFGFFLIIVCSSLLTLQDIKKFKFNASFFYMLLVAIVLALDTVIYKYILNAVPWSTAFTFVLVSSWGFSLCFLLHQKARKDIVIQLKEHRASFKFLTLEEIMAFTGNTAGTFVLSLVPVTLARGLMAFTPFIVLFYGVVLNRFFPKLFHENVERKNIMKKILLFLITLVGVYLIARAEV